MDRLGHARLQQMRLSIGKVNPIWSVPACWCGRRRCRANFFGGNETSAGFYTGDTGWPGLDRRDLAVLDDVNAEGVRSAGKAPDHRIVPRDPAAALHHGAQHRMPQKHRARH